MTKKQKTAYLKRVSRKIAEIHLAMVLAGDRDIQQA